MSLLEPQHLLIVKQPRGLIIRDTPRPESQGSRAMRTVAVGTQLYAYKIIDVSGVEYALLVPQNPQKPEWCRVKEADGSIVYVEVIDLVGGSNQWSGVVRALERIADALVVIGQAIFKR